MIVPVGQDKMLGAEQRFRYFQERGPEGPAVLICEASPEVPFQAVFDEKVEFIHQLFDIKRKGEGRDALPPYHLNRKEVLKA